MENKFHYVELFLEPNLWEEVINSKQVEKISNVVKISRDEYESNNDSSLTEKINNKFLNLNHTPSNNFDGDYKLLEYKLVNNSSESPSIFIKTKRVENIKKGKAKVNPNKFSKLQHISPLNSNSSCANSSCFMGVWGVFSIFGLLLTLILFMNLFNGNSLYKIQDNLPGCNNCIDKVVDFFNSENRKINDEELDQKEIDKINPKKEPIRYLKYNDLPQSNKLDITLLWSSKSDLDLIAVDPDGEMLWKNNKISSFGIMDKSMNDSKLDSLNKYSLKLSLKSVDSTAIEHLYFPEGITLKKGKYKFFVLNSDKRDNCKKNESFYLKVIHEGKIKYYSDILPNAINNRCLNEISFKQVYTAEKLKFYTDNKAASMVFELNVN
jgi:hypothetical protein